MELSEKSDELSDADREVALRHEDDEESFPTPAFSDFTSAVREYILPNRPLSSKFHEARTEGTSLRSEESADAMTSNALRNALPSVSSSLFSSQSIDVLTRSNIMHTLQR